jgi:regulator of nonsense transcripts 3
LAEKVRSTTFSDAKNSGNDACLLGPPTLEFAPYGRVPTARARKDGRQGTIDQDQDFIDFLQELTNPITKPAPVDSFVDKTAKTEEKVVTPLIQFLRDKKANKGKDNVTAKGGKHGRQESKDSKTTVSLEKKSASTKGKDTQSEKKVVQNPKVEKAAKEAVKVLNKQAAAKNTAASAPSTPAASSSPAPQAKPERRRERGNAAAAAKILQRDLGLGGGPPGRKRKENVASNSQPPLATATKENVPKSGKPSVAPTSSPSTASTQAVNPPTATKAVQPPTGPAAVRQQPKQAPVQSKGAVAAAVASNATQAFLKHANPSQGVTEPLLQEAFAAFGPVSRVEIDKKKGFAYIDFAEPGGLQKAITASPVKVAQGQVVVLERKTGANLQNRNAKSSPPAGPARGNPVPMRGGRGGGRGRGGKAVESSAAKGTLTAPAATSNVPATKATAAESGPPP